MDFFKKDFFFKEPLVITDKEIEITTIPYDVEKKSAKLFSQNNKNPLIPLIVDYGSGITDESINHPLILTECFGNPSYCRANMIEMFFECYKIPRLIFGIDALFSYYNYLGNDFKLYQSETSLIIHFGMNTTHLVPFVNGILQKEFIKRINVGTFQSFEIFQKNLLLKSSTIKHKLTFPLTNSLFCNYTQVAYNFSDQLNYFREGKKYFQNICYKDKITSKNRKIFFEDNEYEKLIEPIYLKFEIENIIPIIDYTKKTDFRKEQAARLKESINKRREEKKLQQQQELQFLENIEKSYKENPNEIASKLENTGLTKIQDVIKQIKNLKIKLGLISKKELEEEKINLINIPDENLTADQLRQKKFQLIQKQAAETREAKKILDKKNKEEVIKLKESNPKLYIDKLYDKRKHVLNKLEKCKKERMEMNVRNSRASQKRMHTLAQLGSETGKKEKEEDLFGLNDKDWNIYRGISKEIGSDEENYDMKLNEIDAELREIDPDFEIATKEQIDDPHLFLLQNSYLIDLKTERIKGNEIYFQPSICGTDQGGGSQTKNMEERIKKDLIGINPIGTEIIIKKTNEHIFGTWFGMKGIYENLDISQFGITLEEYLEKGSNIYNENKFSNFISEI